MDFSKAPEPEVEHIKVIVKKNAIEVDDEEEETCLSLHPLWEEKEIFDIENEASKKNWVEKECIKDTNDEVDETRDLEVRDSEV